MRNATDYPVPGRATAGWQAAGTTVDRTPGAGACLIEWRRALGPSRGQHLRGGHLAGGGARIRGTCPIGLPGRPASSGYRPISACPLFGMDARPQRFARPLGPGERLAQRGRERQVPEPHGAHRRSAPAGAAGAAGLSRGPDTMIVAKGCVTHSPRCDAVASMEWVGEGCRRATRRNDRGRRGFAGPPARIRDRLPTPVDAAVVAISHRAYRPRRRRDSNPSPGLFHATISMQSRRRGSRGRILPTTFPGRQHLSPRQGVGASYGGQPAGCRWIPPCRRRRG